MALSIVAWCPCFKSENWQAILRRNLVRSNLHQKASCTTYSPASESTHHHGISKLFSRASTTCYTATWKDGEITALSPGKHQPGKRSFVLFWGRLQFHMPWQELICLFSSAFPAAHSKLYKYFKEVAETVLQILSQIQWLYLRNLTDVDCDFTSTDRIPGFPVAHSKLYKYFKEVAETVLQFLSQIQWLDPRNLTDVECDITSIDSIPGFQAVSK